MIVVTGATGNVGRSLVQILAAAGADVVATSRSVTADGLPAGVGHVQADLTDAETLRPVLDGADALFLQNGGPSAHLVDAPLLMDVAKTSGVGRVVLLSSQAVETRPGTVSHGRVGRAIEDAVRGSGLPWTVLRPGGFFSNTYGWAESVRTRRVVAAPFGDVGLPAVDPADIAEVAAAALRAAGHEEQTYVLTGPAPVTPRQQTAALAEALGEAVRFEELTREEAAARFGAFMPAPVLETTLSILGDPEPAERAVSPDVERVLGRAPGSYAEWAVRNAAAFR
ncbi:NAD(P)H-binding protein [Streptomyces sp. NPDC003717]|uniref:SDR family oxidoreductase n=1 Tax=Streptomyces sp. NPDC003717 TaxID=3154276 RepID=UPI0033B6E9E6